MAKLAVFCVLILSLVAFSEQGAFKETTPARAQEMYECLQIGLCDLEDEEKRKEMIEGAKECLKLFLPHVYLEVMTEARSKERSKERFFKTDTIDENCDEICAIPEKKDRKEVNQIAINAMGEKLEEYCDEEDGDKEKCDCIDAFFECLDVYTEKYQKEDICTALPKNATTSKI